MQYQLPHPTAIRGDQIIAEVLAATGIDMTNHYGFSPPDTLVVAPEYDVYAPQIAAVIAAHVPNPLYTQADQDRAALRQRITTIAQSAVGIAITDLTTTQIKALLACLLYRAGALDTNGIVQPLGTWL